MTLRAEGPGTDRTGNDATIRDRIWHRFGGDDWAAFDALPAAVRARIAAHAYDAWSVNALILWRRFRRQHVSAERAMLRYLDHCDRLERRSFAHHYAARFGAALPHDAAGVTTLRATRAQPSG